MRNIYSKISSDMQKNQEKNKNLQWKNQGP